MNERRAFSLIELLIVLAILAVMLAIAAASLRPFMQRSKLAEAASQVATDLQRARSFAQRENVAAHWTLVDSQSYRLTLDTQTLDYQLPTGLTFTSPAAGTTITYTAPYGELAAAVPTKITLEGYGYVTEVRVVGVTGKVIRAEVKKK